MIFKSLRLRWLKRTAAAYIINERGAAADGCSLEIIL